MTHETCDACGNEIFEGKEYTIQCDGCGFTWAEIEVAQSVVWGVAEVLGVDPEKLSEETKRKALDVTLGLITPE